MNARDRIFELREKILKELMERRKVPLTVVLLGPGGRGLELRREIAEALAEKNIVAILMEDLLPDEAGFSLAEKELLSREGIDLIFVIPESPGSIAEFSEFIADERISERMRVVVQRKYHPLYGGEEGGYLRDRLLIFQVERGHLYAYGDCLPPVEDLVVRLSEAHRALKMWA